MPGGRPVKKESTSDMTRTATERNFEGPYKKLLVELAGLIEWLQTEHDVSYVKAGDDKIYAYGGDGLVLVMDESGLNGLIELITPKGALSIKPAEDGKITVTSAAEGEAAVKEILREAIDGVRRYYENRYWSTPTTSAKNES
jgi:hypothetical protein